MNNNNEIKVETRDKVLRAWENSKELVRDFENYAKEIHDDEKVSKLFSKFAEDEGVHAAKLLEVLHSYQMK